jgi:hypothetical protein
MSLPAAQQRVLDGIEGALRASEPRLTSMYTIFAQLNVSEPVATERLMPKRRWIQQGTAMYAIVLVPVLFAAVIVGALLGSGARSANACEAGYSLGGVSPLATKPSCPVPGAAAVAKNAMNAMNVKNAARKTKAVTARLACATVTAPARFTSLTARDLLFPPAAQVVTAAAGSPGMC